MARLSEASQGVTKTIDPRSAGKAGFIQAYAGATAPSGWMLCEGQAVSRTDFSQLFANVGTKYGVGDGSTTFNLPDGPLRSKQFDLSLSSTPTGWSADYAVGYLEKVEGGKWYLEFLIKGSYTSSTAAQSLVIDGLTGTKDGQAITCMGEASFAPAGQVATTTGTVFFYVMSNSCNDFRVQGRVEISAPTDAYLAASSYSTLSEIWESTPIIKLYDDSTTAVSVSVAEATADTAGVVKKQKIYVAAASAEYLAADNGSNVLAKTLPAGTYRFTISGYMSRDATNNCIATMQRGGSTFTPLGGSAYVNRAHLVTAASGQQGSQTLSFIYTNPSTAEFRISLSIAGGSGVGNLSWTAETIEDLEQL